MLSPEGFTGLHRAPLPLQAFPLRPHPHTSAGINAKRQAFGRSSYEVRPVLPVILRSVNVGSLYSLAGGPFLFFLEDPAPSGRVNHPHVLSSPFFFSSSFFSFLNCCSQILSMFRVFVVCVFFLVTPPGRYPLGVTLKTQKKSPPALSFWIPPPGGVHSQNKKSPLPGGKSETITTVATSDTKTNVLSSTLPQKIRDWQQICQETAL